MCFSHDVERQSGALELVFEPLVLLRELLDLAVLGARSTRRRGERAGVTGASPLGQLTRVHALAPGEGALGPRFAGFVAREDVQLLLDAENAPRRSSRGVHVVVHFIILVMRSHLGGVGCCHWSFVSLVSPREMEFVRQVSHADLRVRGVPLKQ